MRQWHERYGGKGLVILGVHSPEFDYEHNAANVRDAISRLNVPYAVTLDNDFSNWKRYNTWAWPSMYLIDKRGRIRFTHVGEGAYAETEKRIQELIGESG